MSPSDTPRRRTVLVTGGCGYLGAQLIRDLMTDPALGPTTVRVLDNMQRGHTEALMDLPEGADCQFVEGDILDPAAVRLALRGVDAVVHLAALVTTPMSFGHPIWVEQVNHWGTSRLVEGCLTAGVRRFIYASSAAVYGPGGPHTEASQPRPLGPYAQSKRSAEHAVEAATRRGLDATILRFGTLYGLGQATRYDAVINRFAYLAGVRRSLTVYGDGEQRRPFVHLKDASAAVTFCLEPRALEGGPIFNVVSENLTVGELVEAVREAIPEAPVHYADQDVLTHQSFIVDGARLKAQGWRPALTHRDGLGELLGHFRGLRAAGGGIPEVV